MESPVGKEGGRDGRAPTPGLLADLGVEAWPDHLLVGGDGATRCGGAELRRGQGGRGEDGRRRIDGEVGGE